MLYRLAKIKEWIDTNDPGSIVILMSCAVELQLFEMEPGERENYLKERNITRYMVNLNMMSIILFLKHWKFSKYPGRLSDLFYFLESIYEPYISGTINSSCNMDH